MIEKERTLMILPQQQLSEKPEILPPTLAPLLSDKTRSFIQKAYALGVAEKLLPRQMVLLARYTADDEISYADLAPYSGTTRARVYDIIKTSITHLWKGVSPEMQEAYPLEELLKGKKNGRKERVKFREEEIKHRRNNPVNRTVSDETRDKLRAKNLGRKLSKETRERIGTAKRGVKRSEEAKERIRMGLKNSAKSKVHLQKLHEQNRLRNRQKKEMQPAEQHTQPEETVVFPAPLAT